MTEPESSVNPGRASQASSSESAASANRAGIVYGLAGEIALAAAERSEADGMGLLLQLMVITGSLIGRGPRAAHVRAGADKHYGNLFAAIVGSSAAGRKGSGLTLLLQIAKSVDPLWARDSVQSGLVSGEGLVWAVRDRTVKADPTNPSGPPILVDAGVTDKRLLLAETEFGSLLRSSARPASTLSTALRQAWDNGQLQTLGKKSPARATDAHISLIGHVTVSELGRHFSRDDILNGLANRILWITVHRTRPLPSGGGLDEPDVSRYAQRLREAVAYGRIAGELRRNAEAERLWNDWYVDLWNGRHSTLDTIAARGPAQVMRLACIFAVLALATDIRASHLRAAVNLWSACARSAAAIFDGMLDSSLAARLLTALRDQAGGMTRTEIRDLLGRNKAGWEIAEALMSLRDRGEIVLSREAGSGRPTERWTARLQADKS